MARPWLHHLAGCDSWQWCRCWCWCGGEQGRGPYTIVGGVPARLIRERFDAATGNRLDRLAWWDWSHDRLRDALDDFRALDIEAFLSKYETAANTNAVMKELSNG